MTSVLKIPDHKGVWESTVSKDFGFVENAVHEIKMEDFFSKICKSITPAVCYAALALAYSPTCWSVCFLWGLSADLGVAIYRH